MIVGIPTQRALDGVWGGLVASTILLFAVRAISTNPSGEGKDAACRIFVHPGATISAFGIGFFIVSGIAILISPSLTRLPTEEGEPPVYVSVLDIVRETATPTQFISLVVAVSIICIILAGGIFYLLMTARAFRRGESCVPDRGAKLIDPIAAFLVLSLFSFYILFYVVKDYIGLTVMQKIQENSNTLSLIDYRTSPDYENAVKSSLLGQTIKQVQEKMDITINEEKQQEIINNVLNWVVEGD